jgi:hypothetical protein
MGARQSSAHRFGSMAPAPTCYICATSEGELVVKGCACRTDDIMYVHVKCAALAAMSNGSTEAWMRCQTCTERFSGDFRAKLARAWYDHVKGDSPLSEARIQATRLVATTAAESGESDFALRMLDDLYAAMANDGHKDGSEAVAQVRSDRSHIYYTLREYTKQQKELLAIIHSGLREDHDLLIDAKIQVALSIMKTRGDLREAEKHMTQGAEACVLKHSERSNAAISARMNQAALLAAQKKYPAAVDLLRNTHAIAQTVLGKEHTRTLVLERNFATYILEWTKDNPMGRNDRKKIMKEATTLAQHVATVLRRANAQGSKSVHNSLVSAEALLAEVSRIK